MQGRAQAATTLSRGARVTVTVLLLVLPVCSAVLALTAPPGVASGWWWFALLNAVLPAVILPFVWRAPSDDAETGPVDELRDLAPR